MSDFQKNLEHYYSTMEGDGKLYYERRSKQYNADASVVKRRIITVPLQIKTFSAMFLRNPHLVTSYFGSITKNIGEPGSNIFESDHQYAPYYLSALAYYRLDTLFMSGQIDTKYKKVKYYILMLFMMHVSSERFNNYKSIRKAESFCQPIINKLNNLEECKKIFLKAILIIDKADDVNIDDKHYIKSKVMTDKLIQEASK